jgi:holo-[acyl-carrier protein] synthase
MALAVGIDLVRTDEVRATLARHGERYLKRVYTCAERRDCGSDPRALATRFAAKEATMKALGWGDSSLPWLSVAVGRDASGRPCMRLSGTAAEVAQRRGVCWLEVSLTPGRAVAVAVVVAELD